MTSVFLFHAQLWVLTLYNLEIQVIWLNKYQRIVHTYNRGVTAETFAEIAAGCVDTFCIRITPRIDRTTTFVRVSTNESVSSPALVTGAFKWTKVIAAKCVFVTNFFETFIDVITCWRNIAGKSLFTATSITTRNVCAVCIIDAYWRIKGTLILKMFNTSHFCNFKSCLGR